VAGGSAVRGRRYDSRHGGRLLNRAAQCTHFVLDCRCRPLPDPARALLGWRQRRAAPWRAPAHVACGNFISAATRCCIRTCPSRCSPLQPAPSSSWGALFTAAASALHACRPLRRGRGAAAGARQGRHGRHIVWELNGGRAAVARAQAKAAREEYFAATSLGFCGSERPPVRGVPRLPAGPRAGCPGAPLASGSRAPARLGCPPSSICGTRARGSRTSQPAGLTRGIRAARAPLLPPI